MLLLLFVRWLSLSIDTAGLICPSWLQKLSKVKWWTSGGRFIVCLSQMWHASSPSSPLHGWPVEDREITSCILTEKEERGRALKEGTGCDFHRQNREGEGKVEALFAASQSKMSRYFSLISTSTVALLLQAVTTDSLYWTQCRAADSNYWLQLIKVVWSGPKSSIPYFGKGWVSRMLEGQQGRYRS